MLLTLLGMGGLLVNGLGFRFRVSGFGVSGFGACMISVLHGVLPQLDSWRIS